ncbi:MAG: D-alanine--D-alanine ligase [Chitinophagia bacterium]|nr:D-alanine--D-alanine ligase [Chitinophagia bacterium]
MKKNIALVTGGLSSEAQISYKSAETVKAHLNRSKYNVYYIDIHPSGWWFVSEPGERIPVNKENFTVTWEGATIVFDVALMCIHGTPGEDGKMQGYFDLLKIPYTSCDAATSALTFNKRFTVAVVAFSGVQVAKSLHLFAHTPISPEQILHQLRLPVFVKPNNGGSSLGISKVNTSSDLAPALHKAWAEDSQILVEEFIAGREFTIGVCKLKGVVTVLPITEIETQNEFFDFEAKYQGKSKEITPANLSPEMQHQLESSAMKAYEVLNCRGVVRIDFIYSEQHQQPFLLEVNTVPGQSAASVIPQQVAAKGWNLSDFYGALIEEALGE